MSEHELIYRRHWSGDATWCERVDGEWTPVSRPATRAPDAAKVERLAEALSWTSGEFTRYDPDAHPDHNRWSWRGDGHGEVVREEFREQARQVIAALGGGAS